MEDREGAGLDEGFRLLVLLGGGLFRLDEEGLEEEGLVGGFCFVEGGWFLRPTRGIEGRS